jgi:hypothetical protein
MAIPRRGLQDIPTLTGKVKRATLPHEVFLRISHIEMEKARKTLESEKARQRMADIAARLEDIETEKTALLQALAPPGPEAGRGATGPPRSHGGLKIRY